MTNISISRLFGIALIAGGTIVGIVLMILMSNYAKNGVFTSTTATIITIAAFIILVLPQIGLGSYLIWDSMQETAVPTSPSQDISPSENSPSPK
jgi:uncharacterized membrane protein YcaP (DUF421 family)